MSYIFGKKFLKKSWKKIWPYRRKDLPLQCGNKTKCLTNKIKNYGTDRKEFGTGG